MNTDIEKALTNLRANSTRYDKSIRYYNGDHDLAFATEKFENTFGTLFREFALNLCPVICDAVRDKLRVTGFSVEASTNNSANSVNSATREIWFRNRMASRAGEIHKEALKCGDAYVFVWPDALGKAVFYPNSASGITVVHNEGSPGSITWAAKSWTDADKRIRLNILYPDRIERYISRTKADTFPDPTDMIAFADDSDAGYSVIANPYGVVPVFHFANNADLGQLGRSELDAAMPVQDGLNKSVLDMLVAMEYSAFRQRWAAGIEVEYGEQGKSIAPFDSGVDHLWIAGNPSAKFGDFETAQLEQFLKVKDSFRIDMASVTGTPLHYFLQVNAGLPSGEAPKKSETRFIAKVRDRQESFGQVWADVMAFALRIEHGSDAKLITEWEDPSPLSEREFLENILLKRQIGLPVDKALIEAGYGVADVSGITS
ncbi:MAG: phage portal protein [Pyrinomonadaceae bacterium]